ncbi:MAG: S-layer homology domain-containing protein [Oscillospiraceae bacterium]|nr:S-layer homology domain-containing protein [Oscillospiraceae bacterium]
MKKITALVTLWVLLVTNVCVSAETASVTANADYIQNEISVSYSSGLLYNTAVTFVLTRSDAVNSPENWLRISEADYVPGKNAECKIPFGNDITCREGHEHCETYKVYAVPGGWKSGDFSAVSTDFVICCSEKQEDLLESVNTKPDAESFECVKEILSTYFGIDVSGADPGLGAYIKQMQKDDYNGNYSNLGELPEAWKVSNILLKINSAKDSDALKTIVTDNAETLCVDIDDPFYKTDIDGVYEKLFGLLDTDKAFSLKAFKSKMNDSVAISSFGYACGNDLESLDSVFEKFSDTLGISDSDMATYRDLKKANSSFSSNFARQFYNCSETSPAKIGSKFKELLSRFSNNNSSSNSGGGSSGSGGGSGGGGGGSGGKMTIRGEENGLGEGTVNITTSPGETNNNDTKTFSDIDENHWAYGYVMSLYDYGVISGYEDGSFRPDALITRGEFIKLITDSLNINGDPDKPVSFTDVGTGSWVYPYVQRFASVGGISGYEDGSLGVNKNISRQDAAVFIERALKIKNKTFIDAGSAVFIDEDDISDYAKDAVKTLCGANIITGFEDGSFMPRKNLTRAQAAALIYKASSK